MTTKYCKCGCGLPTPLAKRTQTARGETKGQPLAYVPGHRRKEKFSSLDWRTHQSEVRTGHEAVISPYVPGLVLRWSKERQRWQCRRPGSRSSQWHSQAVWEHFYGPVPEGMHVHHKNGRADRIEDDHPDNLMLLDRKWNSDVFPTLSRTMGVPEHVITEAFLLADPSWGDDRILAFVVNEVAQRKGL